jgi:DNA-3-methyladenine glycosylase
VLPVSFFRQSATEVAAGLLGCVVESVVEGQRTWGRIVEVEAYLGHDDPASHAFRGRRHAGNRGVYSPPGHWYVYRSYGIHWCMNLCCWGPDGSAVLLRALEPLGGLVAMGVRRGGQAVTVLCAGPGRLTQALGVTNALDGVAMRTSAVRVHGPARDTRPEAIALGPRVGITQAADWPLRFALRGARLSRPLQSSVAAARD